MNGLKVIDGKYCKECNVVMLPIEKIIHEGDLVLGKRLFKTTQSCTGYKSNFKPQHLYILSDEKIKEGDWFIKDTMTCQCNEITKNEIGCVPDNKIFCGTQTYFDRRNCKKIIATTDNFLGLPRPSKEFIEAYIRTYNSEDGPVTEVVVEYVNFCEYEEEETWEIHPDWRLKIKPDNTISIKKVKNSWNRKEVLNLFTRFSEKYIKDYDKISVKNSIKAWIEENL